MFSREESKKLRQDFWIAFGKSYPRKWVLYNTKIKGLAFKFHFDIKIAMVVMDVDTTDLSKRITLWDTLASLKNILLTDYLPNAQFEDSYILESQKEVSRIYVILDKVSIHNKNTWQETMQFFTANMDQFESFFAAYKDVINP